MDVALATCAWLPEPDPDAEPLDEALRQAGLSSRRLAWDDPDHDFSEARITLLRSTWNYPSQPESFVEWAVRTASVSALWNPLEVLRWNLHKSYLLELERRGIPIAPTELLPRGSTRSLASVLEARGWSDVVVKPAISAASFRTTRVRPDDLERGESELGSLLTERDVLVQRYLSSVEDYGERALVWVDGELTHAVRKSPRFSDEDESISPASRITPEEADLARSAVEAVGHDLLYARIDIAPGEDGLPRLMELELIEPSLFFAHGAGALPRLISGLRQRLQRLDPSAG